MYLTATLRYINLTETDLGLVGLCEPIQLCIGRSCDGKGDCTTFTEYCSARTVPCGILPSSVNVYHDYEQQIKRDLKKFVCFVDSTFCRYGKTWSGVETFQQDHGDG